VNKQRGGLSLIQLMMIVAFVGIIVAFLNAVVESRKAKFELVQQNWMCTKFMTTEHVHTGPVKGHVYVDQVQECWQWTHN
jgi:hypothetical protein